MIQNLEEGLKSVQKIYYSKPEMYDWLDQYVEEYFQLENNSKSLNIYPKLNIINVTS